MHKGLNTINIFLDHGKCYLPGIQGPKQASLLSNKNLRHELSPYWEASLLICIKKNEHHQDNDKLWDKTIWHHKELTHSMLCGQQTKWLTQMEKCISEEVEDVHFCMPWDWKETHRPISFSWWKDLMKVWSCFAFAWRTRWKYMTKHWNIYHLRSFR